MTVLFVCSACLENGSTDGCQSARAKRLDMHLDLEMGLLTAARPL